MKVLIVLTIFAYAYATNRCCCPSKYEGFVETVIGTSNADGSGKLNQMAGKIYMDSTRNMLVYDATMTINHGTPFKIRSIQDYNKHVMYTVDPYGHCTKSKTPFNSVFNLKCLNDTMITRTGYIGLPTDKKVVYTVDINNSDGTIASYSVDDKCIFVDMVMTYGTSMQATRFSDVTLGVDESVFNIPASCPQD